MNRLRTTFLRAFSAAIALIVLPGAGLPEGPPKITFDLHGYFRVRGTAFFNLFDKEFPRDGARAVNVYYLEDAEQIPQDFRDRWNETHTNYTTNDLVQGYCRSFPAQCRRAIRHPERSHWITQRGRFEPVVRFGDTLKLTTTIDVFDNVVWGDNENLAATPLFAGEPSSTQVDGTVVDTVRVKRLWLEWSTAFGTIRVGRQPSNWGLGLLANDGDAFKNDFGDSYGGAVYDRILWATKPISVIRGVAAIAQNKPTPDTSKDPFVFVLAFDKLVESSSITFQKRITKDDSVADENAEGDANIRRSPIWLSDNGDDVWEIVFAALFRRENMKVSDQVMDLTFGTYVVHRWQPETESRVWIPDFWLNWKFRGVFVQSEVYFIAGTTQAISPKFDKTTKANIQGLAVRAGYENPNFTGLFEIGHASGDDVILDERFRGRPLAPDYNVGLILYEQVLAQRTIEKFVGDPDTRGLWSNGGVYNSTYLNPRFKFRPGDITEFRLGLLFAWADEVDGAIIPYLEREDGTQEDGESITESKFLGFEIDAGAHFKWADEHIHLSFEGGYMRAGERLGRTTQYQDPREAAQPLLYNAAQYDQIRKRLANVFTLQSRVAFVF